MRPPIPNNRLPSPPHANAHLFVFVRGTTRKIRAHQQRFAIDGVTRPILKHTNSKAFLERCSGINVIVVNLVQMSPDLVVATNPLPATTHSHTVLQSPNVEF
jgi:hypothetical protein